MTTFVIDASVAIKWIIDEPGTPEALRFRGHRLWAPDLLIAEIANVLWKKVRRKELTEEEAMVAARLMARSDVELEPMRALLEPATRLSIILNHPAYDCVYLALAERLDCAFVTADDTFGRKTLAAGLTSKVLTLSNANPV